MAQAQVFPLVSVIVPAYNAEAFLAQTLDSILAQTYPHFEVLVVDDGSTDGTAAIVRAYADRDSRFRLLQQPNGGVAAARNYGIREAKGEFIAPIDADDLWFPENLERQIQTLLGTGPEVGLVYTWSIDIDENGQPTGVFRASRIAGSVYTTLLLHDFIANASSVMLRRSCLEKVGGYNSNLREQHGQGGEDWDLYLRVAEYYQFCFVPAFLVGYRKLANSMSKDFSQMAKSRQLIWTSIRSKYPHIPRVIERLSNSSFYMHLASQSSQIGQSQDALFWLYQAVKSDFITPFLRPSFYIIFVLNVLAKKASRGNLSQKERKSQPLQDSKKLDSGLKEQSLKYSSVKTDVIMSHLDSQRFLGNMNLKTLIEPILHKLALRLFGTLENWA